MKENFADQVIHATIRIECNDKFGNKSSGTGFFYQFCMTSEGLYIPALVTNKHVIKDANSVLINVHSAGEDGRPIYGQHISVPITNLNCGWIPHPDPAIDLTVAPVADLFYRLRGQGKKVFIKAVNKSISIDVSKTDDITAIEDIIMVGYPNGLWDSKNNLPLVRRGVTATPLYLDFEGRKEFVIDCACFPGSSGSPIFLYNTGSYINKKSEVQFGSRFAFAGVLWGGPQRTDTGEIKAVPVPASNVAISVFRTPINLGYCLKAEALDAFEPILWERFGQQVSSPPSESETL